MNTNPVEIDEIKLNNSKEKKEHENVLVLFNRFIFLINNCMFLID